MVEWMVTLRATIGDKLPSIQLAVVKIKKPSTTLMSHFNHIIQLSFPLLFKKKIYYYYFCGKQEKMSNALFGKTFFFDTIVDIN
jgi:hypothetical protein